MKNINKSRKKLNKNKIKKMKSIDLSNSCKEIYNRERINRKLQTKF